MNPLIQELLNRLGNFRRWLRLRDAAVLAQRSFWLASLFALGAQIVGRLVPIDNLWFWTFFPFLLWALTGMIWALAAPISTMRVARRIDYEFDLKERLSTALALENQPANNGTSPESPSLIELQRQDALEAVRRHNPQEAFHLPWLRRPLAVAAVFLAAALLVAFLPNPMESILAEREVVKQEIEEQQALIQDLATQIENESALSPEERERILRELAELARQLEANPGNREQALADFAAVEENLQRQIDPNLDLRAAALASLEAQLENLARQQTSTENQDGSLAETLQEMSEQIGELQSAEQAELAQSLAELANQAAQSGNLALAQAIGAMAQSALNGDTQSASQSAQEAIEALKDANQEIDAQQALAQALAQLQAARQQIAQAGQNPQVAGNQGNAQSGSQGQNSGTSQSSGQNPGQGQSAGQGQSQGQGQTSGGGGTNANTLPPGQSQGQAGRPQGPGQAADAGRLDSQVYVPFANPGANEDDLFIPGQDTGQGQTQVREGQDPLPGASNPALVPYQEVYGQYLQAASQAVDRGTIPPALREYIKAYFTELEP